MHQKEKYLSKSETKMVSTLSLKQVAGFSKILESGYDEDADLFYIAMEHLDEDLSTVVKKSPSMSL